MLFYLMVFFMCTLVSARIEFVLHSLSSISGLNFTIKFCQFPMYMQLLNKIKVSNVYFCNKVRTQVKIYINERNKNVFQRRMCLLFCGDGFIFRLCLTKDIAFLYNFTILVLSTRSFYIFILLIISSCLLEIFLLIKIIIHH